MFAFIFTFALALIAQPLFISWIQNRGLKGQPIRDDGPKGHETKQGTPTMGGIVTVLSVALSTLLLARWDVLCVWVALGVFLAYAGIGFVDDWQKVSQQNTKGLSGKGKLLTQGIVALLAAFVLYRSGFSTELSIPFLKDITIDLGLIFIPFSMLVIVGCSNAVNLTDGLDGLAIGPVMTVSATFAIFAYVVGHAHFAEYLGFAQIQGAGELVVLLSAVVAGGLGFLWYNTFPAQVFMGDLGSLALGGLLGVVAVIIKQEVLLVICGGIFVAEALSVMIQVYSFRMTGKRVFRMAPIHHHFELKGWKEPKIIVRFWIISIVLALLSLTSLKLR